MVNMCGNWLKGACSLARKIIMIFLNLLIIQQNFLVSRYYWEFVSLQRLVRYLIATFLKSLFNL